MIRFILVCVPSDCVYSIGLRRPRFFPGDRMDLCARTRPPPRATMPGQGQGPHHARLRHRRLQPSTIPQCQACCWDHERHSVQHLAQKHGASSFLYQF
ncbi:hypothetical protein BDA96_01G092500 [Sorghum bicolor]|uniref:Uncharacterized protein n=1 Tax=Sorghum bicolor TaxID=4558 RepID=A0A921RX23_SORBI|nr:hypothetical protein BDA96_01G092500 [Sorghum bicolor]